MSFHALTTDIPSAQLDFAEPSSTAAMTGVQWREPWAMDSGYEVSPKSASRKTAGTSILNISPEMRRSGGRNTLDLTSPMSPESGVFGTFGDVRLDHTRMVEEPEMTARLAGLGERAWRWRKLSIPFQPSRGAAEMSSTPNRGMLIVDGTGIPVKRARLPVLGEVEGVDRSVKEEVIPAPLNIEKRDSQAEIWKKLDS